jgi:hypothetical protein
MLVANDRTHLEGCVAEVIDRLAAASLIAVLLAAILNPAGSRPSNKHRTTDFPRR